QNTSWKALMQNLFMYLFLFFSVPPSVDLDVKLIEGLVVKAGSTVRFPAIMRGVPVPTAKWVTDDTEIKSEGNFKIDTDSYSTVLTIKSCTRKDTGEYLLTVSNIVGSKTVPVHLTVLDVPGPPTGPIDILEVHVDHMVIAWRPPKDDGGSLVINYIVEKRESKKNLGSCQATGLFEGCTYEFRAFAENSVGLSKPSPVSDPIKASRPITPPGPPINPKLKDKTRETAELVWTKPLKDVGQTIKITGKVKGRPIPDIAWSRDVKKALRADHGKYLITAKNSSGHAQASAIVNVLDRPGPCQHLKVSYVTKESCVVSWENPEDNGVLMVANTLLLPQILLVVL
uniref:Titin n=1 Tax=Anolis carolinensis TaxID=28377 RepID=A0A803SSP3_ANOCA